MSRIIEHPLGGRGAGPRRALRAQIEQSDNRATAVTTLNIWVREIGLTRAHLLDLADEWGVAIPRPSKANVATIKATIIDHLRASNESAWA